MALSGGALDIDAMMSLDALLSPRAAVSITVCRSDSVAEPLLVGAVSRLQCHVSLGKSSPTAADSLRDTVDVSTAQTEPQEMIAAALARAMRPTALRASGFTGRAIDAMLGYRWPGNIRELENVVERGVILAPERGAIDIVHLFSGGEDLEFNHLALNRGGTLGKPAPARGNRGGLEYGEPDRISRVRSKITHLLAGVADDAEPTSLQDIEDALVDSAVRTANGNLAAAARLLGMTRAQLVYRHKSRRPSQE